MEKKSKNEVKETSDTINKRIEKLIPILKMNTTSFSKSLGITPSAINAVTLRGTKPGFQTIESIINIYKVNPIWLMTGKGEIFSTNEAKESLQKQEDIALMRGVINQYEKMIEDLRYTVQIQKHLMPNFKVGEGKMTPIERIGNLLKLDFLVQEPPITVAAENSVMIA